MAVYKKILGNIVSIAERNFFVVITYEQEYITFMLVSSKVSIVFITLSRHSGISLFATYQAQCLVEQNYSRH